MASTNASVKPIDFMPEAKTAAAAISNATSQNASPQPRQKRLETSPPLSLLAKAINKPTPVPINMQHGTVKMFEGNQPTCLEAITSKNKGKIGTKA